MQQTSSGDESIMAQQNHHEEIPRMIATDPRYRNHQPQQRDFLDEKTPKVEIVTSWLWPVSSWFIMGFNAVMCSMAIWKGDYSTPTQFSLIIAFSGSVAALSATYKYIIMKEK